MTDGHRFSQTYLERGKPEKDTARFRRRIQEKFVEFTEGSWQRQSAFGKMLARECGANVSVSGDRNTYFPLSTFEKGELRDVLDAITIFFQFLTEERSKEIATHQTFRRVVAEDGLKAPKPGDWVRFVERVFIEENLGYRVDQKGGVHFYVDAEFDHARTSTIKALDHPSLVNARSSFNDAFRHLDSSPMDTKAAVRSMFEAAEVLAKQIVPGSKNLNRKLVETTIKAHFVALNRDDVTEAKVWGGMLDGMGDWVDALHNYRHGQPADEPVAPSEELAVFAISSGCTYVRALANCVVRI